MEIKLKKIFMLDASYTQMNAAYDKKDAQLAVGFYIFLILIYLCLGIIQAKLGIYLAVYANLLSIAVCIAIVLARKQKLESVGFTLNRLSRSVIVGVIWGMILSTINIIPAITSGGKWLGFSKLLLSIPFFLIVIGLQEELIFRGFILSRLHGAIKSEAVVAIVCGLMFAMMHVPYQLFNKADGNVVAFFTDNAFWILTTFGWHFVFYFLYRKYNSLTTSTLCHFLMDLSNTLFG